MTVKMTHFIVQMSHEAGKPLILLIFVCYSPRSFFGDPELRHLFSNLFYESLLGR